MAADASVTERVLAKLAEHMKQEQNPLADSPEALEQLRISCQNILGAVHAELAPYTPNIPASHDPRDLGRQRAIQGVHPRYSLEATISLFEIAIEELVGAYPAAPPSRVATALHAHITRSVATSAVGYVDLLMERLSQAQLDERRRVARDMHDTVAHEVGAGALGLELLLATAEDRLDEDITARINATHQQLGIATNNVRSMAHRLRDMVEGRSLYDTLANYLDTQLPQGWKRKLHTDLGNIHIPNYIIEQSYLIIREAIRNSVLHAAKADELTVQVVAGPRKLTAVIQDNGGGFDSSTTDPNSTGLLSMRERANAINGDVTIFSNPSHGAQITLEIPLDAAAE